MYKKSSLNIHETGEHNFKPEDFQPNFFTQEKKKVIVSNYVKETHETKYVYNLYGYTDIAGVYFLEYGMRRIKSDSQPQKLEKCILMFSPIKTLDKATQRMLKDEYLKIELVGITTPLNLNSSDLLLLKNYLLEITNSISLDTHEKLKHNLKLNLYANEGIHEL